MFTRKGQLIKSTIFDISSFSEEEKKEVLDNIKKSYTDSVKSCYSEKGQTFLVFPGFLDNSYFYKYHFSANNALQRMLFNDCFGYNRILCKDSSYSSKIMDKTFLNGKLQSHHTKELSKISVDNENTELILKNHFKKEYALLNKKETSKSNSLSRTKPGYRLAQAVREDYIDGTAPGCDCEYCRNKRRERSKREYNVTHLIWVDALYTLSELPILSAQENYLRVRGKDTYFKEFSNIYSEDNDYKWAEDIVKKHEAKKFFMERNKSWPYLSNTSYIEDMLNDALSSYIEENDIEIEIKKDKNIFIPVSYIIMLDEASILFKDLTSITQETHTKPKADFFFYNTQHIYTMGFPKRSRDPYSKQQTSYNLLPSTVDDHFFTNLLTFIPKGFSQRLLKSKFKALLNNQLQTIVIKDTEYSIPKSILEEDIKTCFSFFSKEQDNEIKDFCKKNKDFKTINLYGEGNVNLSYYVAFLRDHLINRFASGIYSEVITKGDFFVAPLTILGKELDITKLLITVEGKHIELDKLFNKEEIILNNKLFLYEKTVLVFYYLLSKMYGKLIRVQYADPLREKEYLTKKLIEPIINEQGYVSEGTMTAFNNWEVHSTHLSTFVKARMLERIYLLLNNNYSIGEITKILSDIEKMYLEEGKKELEVLKITFSPLKTVRKIMEEKNKDMFIKLFDTNLTGAVGSYIAGKSSKVQIFDSMDNILGLTSLLKHLFLQNFMIELSRKYRMLYYVIYIHKTNPEVKDTIKDLLTNSSIQTKIFDTIYNYYSEGKSKEASYIKNFLKDNQTTQKITTLPELYNEIFEAHFSEYLCSIKE